MHTHSQLKNYLRKQKSRGLIFGAVVAILRNQLRKKFPREIFARKVRKIRAWFRCFFPGGARFDSAARGEKTSTSVKTSATLVTLTIATP